MGKVNAAHAASAHDRGVLARSLLIFGVGGAYPSSGAAVGDVALAQVEIAGDEGVLTHEGFKDTEYIGIPLLKTATSVIFTTYPASEPLLKQALHTLATSSEPGRTGVHYGPFVTLSTCTGTSARARELEERYHGLCENMEGAAVAQVAGASCHPLARGARHLEHRGRPRSAEVGHPEGSRGQPKGRPADPGRMGRMNKVRSAELRNAE